MYSRPGNTRKPCGEGDGESDYAIRFGVAPTSLTMLTQSFTFSVLAIEPPRVRWKSRGRTFATPRCSTS